MNRNVSGVSASRAPGAELTHTIQYTAFTPDDGETRGVATVSAVTDGEGRSVIPWSQLAAIPGFREGDVIDHRDGERRPHLLGPGTDAPGHPAWCTCHDDECGDGQSVCLGETFEVDCGEVERTGGHVVGAGLCAVTGTDPTIDVTADGSGGNRLTLTAAREYARLLLALVEQAEAGLAVSA